MFNIYTKDNDGLHLVESNASAESVRLHRECCSNIVVKDPANDTTQAPDEELSSKYGVSSHREMEAAFNVALCVIGAAICIVIAILTH